MEKWKLLIMKYYIFVALWCYTNNFSVAIQVPSLPIEKMFLFNIYFSEPFSPEFQFTPHDRRVNFEWECRKNERRGTNVEYSLQKK